MKTHLTLPVMEPNTYVIFPEAAGRYYDEPEHWTVRPADTFGFFNLHYVVSGQGYVEVDGEWKLLQPGDAFLYFPNRSQQYRSSTENPWDVYWMHFYGDALPEILTRQGFRRTLLWSTNGTKGLQETWNRLLSEIEHNKLLRPSVLSMLSYGILAEFSAQAVPLLPRRNRDTSQAVLQLLPAMQEAACEPFTLGEWAAKAGCTPFYFCKLFRKVAQMSPMDFIRLCRIRQAKQLLLDDSARPIAEIAQICGYPSVSYFIKRFKEIEGVTPAAYRASFIYRR